MKNKCWLLTLFVCMTGALWGHNVIPNPSFENGTVVPDGDFVANDSNTESWNGGILTTGGNRTFCTPGVPHGSYAMALHKQYPQISVRFHVAVGGVYDLSFFCVSRSMSKESDRCGMTVAARIDGSSQPVVSVCPTSCTQWDRCRGTVALTAGEHVLEFTGTLNPDAKDPSTVLDEICLDLRGQNVISNHSFENGTFLGPDAERENDPSSPVTQDWMGGLICVGRGRSLASCLPPMADGEFGLSLSMDALACQAASNRFSVVEGGLYRLSLLCLQGSGTKDTPALPVAVFFDDASEPVAVCVPGSESVWKTCVAEVALDAGEHVLRLAAAPSAGDSFRRTTLDFVSLVREERQNIVPNPSFEDMAKGETCSDFRENDKAPYVIRAWQGGIATAGGGKTFCDPQMADGKIGLAIHKSYNRAEAKIHVEQGGTHVLSFSYVSRKQSQRCGMRVCVSFDGADEPVVSVLPESAEEWATCRALVQLKPGDHTIRFEGILEHGFSDSSTVIDDVVLSPDNFGLFECAEGLPAGLYDDVENSRGVFVDENDVVTLKARRLFSEGNVYAATGAVVKTSSTSRLSAGETCCVTQDDSVVTVDWLYRKIATRSTNLVPNPGFESDTVIASGDYAVNAEDAPATAAWKGGIVARGGGSTFCDPKMYEGTYGMVLHPSYSTVSVSLNVPEDDTYDFSFAYVARREGAKSCKLAVSVYLDDGVEPLATVLPDSPGRWREYVGQISLGAGAHVLRFSGALTSPVSESSTMIDGIVLRSVHPRGMVMFIR